MVRAWHIVECYRDCKVRDENGKPHPVTLAFLKWIEQSWNGKLAEENLPVLQDYIRRLPAPMIPFPLHSLLVGGQHYRPGWSYILPTKKTPPKTRPRCYHRPLQAQEWPAKKFLECPGCQEIFGGYAERVGHVRAGEIFGREFARSSRKPASSYKRVPTAQDDMSGNRVDACDPRGESAGEILESDNQFIKKFEWMWSMVGRAEPVPELHPSRKWNWHDIRSSAPEIEQRRWRVTIFDQAKLRYRAPHARVRALLDGGLTQQQIAKRLKVTLRTISSRVSELPPEPPKERTAAGLLTLRVEAGGGWHRQSFWPGSSDNIPRGSGWTRPSDGEGVYQQCVPALAVLERQRMTARRAA